MRIGDNSDKMEDEGVSQTYAHLGWWLVAYGCVVAHTRYVGEGPAEMPVQVLSYL